MIHKDYIKQINKLLNPSKKLISLVQLNMTTNNKVWELEDQARVSDLDPKYITEIKKDINKYNQIRNDLINKIDREISVTAKISNQGSDDKFYSESPGMIIDRLSILYIKLAVVENLLNLIKEIDLKKEYQRKYKKITEQMNHLESFLKIYWAKLKNKEVFFRVQEPLKIYNDKRVRKYIKIKKY